MPRLLVCRDCMSVEVLPDSLAPVGEPDPLLDRLVLRHHGGLNREQLARASRLGLPRPREIAECEWHRQGRELPRQDRLPFYGIADSQGFPLEPCGCERHFADLHLVANDDWNDPRPEAREYKRREILMRLWGEDKGFPPEFYAAKDTYQEDAAECYKRHKRPGATTGPYACIDYESEEKRLTDRDWRQRDPDRTDVYLCSFCPYTSVVTTRKRLQRGDYS